MKHLPWKVKVETVNQHSLWERLYINLVHVSLTTYTTSPKHNLWEPLF